MSLLFPLSSVIVKRKRDRECWSLPSVGIVVAVGRSYPSDFTTIFIGENTLRTYHTVLSHVGLRRLSSPPGRLIDKNVLYMITTDCVSFIDEMFHKRPLVGFFCQNDWSIFGCTVIEFGSTLSYQYIHPMLFIQLSCFPKNAIYFRLDGSVWYGWQLFMSTNLWCWWCLTKALVISYAELVCSLQSPNYRLFLIHQN